MLVWVAYGTLAFGFSSFMIIRAIDLPMYHHQLDMLDTKDWVLQQPKGTVAIYDGGIMSYLTDGACLPIDGNVNNEAHKAVTEHRVYEYMKENGVEYLIGWYWIKGRYSPFWGVDFDQAFEQVKVVEPVEKEPVFGVFTIWKLVE